MEERVQKIIAAAGIASRRASEELILEGRVKVNGAVVTELGTKADPERDHIKVDGKLINPQQPKTYVMLNKPVGYVTTMSDPEGRQVVSDLLKGIRTRVYPVGRLDYNTEGLLLLTNDGDFAYLVTHPRHELPKTYLVKIKGVLEDRDIDSLERGVFLKDGKTAPARLRRLRKEESNSWVEITIHEGRKRQVRRMIDHTGKSVIKLKRTRIGSLELGDLPLGTYRHLSLDEVKDLREAAQGSEGGIESRMMPGETVSVPSGPAGAKRQLTFIEGPKPAKRARPATMPRKPLEKHPAKGSAAGGAYRRPATGLRGEKQTARPWQREARTEGKRQWQTEKRGERSSFGGRTERPEGRKPWSESRPSRPSQSRSPRTGEGFKPREGQGRSFGSKAASTGQRGPRPEGRRSWSDARPERPSFGKRTERPEGRKPWSESRPARTPFGGPPRPSQSRTPRTGEGFKAREGRSFTGRTASQGERGRRPESARPWSAEKRASRPGSVDSRPRAGGQRSSGPKAGWARPGYDRDKKGRGPRRRS